MGRFRAHLLGLLLVAFGLALLLPTIDADRLNLWDDGVYSSAAQAMRRHGRYLFTVDDTGKYALRGLSKPPLFLWTLILSLKTFGNGLLALRFPSVLATVLTALVTYWYGLRSAPGSRFGSALGFLAALFVLLNAGAKEYGQAVCIEPVFTVFLWLSMFAYAEAMSATRHALRFAALSGVCLGLAFLTKQAAAGIVVVPFVVAEVLLARRTPRRALARLTVAAIPAIVLAGGWLYLAYKAVGVPLLQRFFVYSVAHRILGFRSNYHYNWLNRVGGELDKTFAPLPWELGLVGVALLAAVAAHARRACGATNRNVGGEQDTEARESLSAFLVPHPERAAFFVLPLLYAVTWVIIYEDASRTILAWYTVGLAFPNAIGLAFMVAAPFVIYETDPSEIEVAAPSRRLAAALLGATAMGSLLVLSRSATTWASRPNVVLLFAIVTLIGLAWNDRLGFIGRFMVSEGRRAAPGFVALAALVMAVRVRPEADAVDVVAHEAAKRGVTALWAEPAYPPSPNPKTILSAYFGLTKLVDGPPPWQQNREKVGLALFGSALPNEIGVGPGVEVTRVLGIHAFFGRLDQPPYAPDAFERALGVGPLSFESEDMDTDFRRSRIDDSNASGGRARAHRPAADVKSGSPQVLGGASVRLAPGQYVARFRIAFGCRGLAGEEIIADLVARESQKDRTSSQVTCPPGYEGKDYYYADLPFEVKKGPLVTVEVVYHRGHLVHDVTQIWRKEVLEKGKVSAS